jgi:hypothetical protein
MAREKLDAGEKFGLAWILGWPIYGLILMMVLNFLTSISHWLDKLDPEIDPERAQEWALNHEAQIAAEDARLEGIRSEVTSFLYTRSFYEAKILVEELKWSSALANPWVRTDSYDRKWSKTRSDLSMQIKDREKEVSESGQAVSPTVASPPPRDSSPSSNPQDPCKVAQLELVQADTMEALELSKMKVEIACQS